MMKKFGVRVVLRATRNDIDVAVSALQALRDGGEVRPREEKVLTRLHTLMIRVDEVLATAARSSGQIETVASLAPELALAVRGLVALTRPQTEIIEGLLDGGDAPPKRVETMADVAGFLCDAADAVGEIVETDAPDVVADFLSQVVGGLRHPDDLRPDEEVALTATLSAFDAVERGLCQIATVLDNAEVIATLTRTARNLSSAGRDYVVSHSHALGALLSGEQPDTGRVLALERALLLGRGVIDSIIRA